MKRGQSTPMRSRVALYHQQINSSCRPQLTELARGGNYKRDHTPNVTSIKSFVLFTVNGTGGGKFSCLIGGHVRDSKFSLDGPQSDPQLLAILAGTPFEC